MLLLYQHHIVFRYTGGDIKVQYGPSFQYNVSQLMSTTRIY